MKVTRFLPLLIPLLSYLSLQFFYFLPKSIYIILFIIIGLNFAASVWLTKRSRKSEKWRNIFILPAYFTISICFFIAMVANNFLIQFLFLLNAIFLYFYYNTVYDYLINIDEYRNFSLENISSYGNFLGIYFASSIVYGFLSFVGIPVWEVMIGLMVVVWLAVYQVFWANQINLSEGVFYILLICLVLVEIAWTATFLPLSFYILGLLFAVCYYMLIGLARFHLLKKLDNRVIRLYLFYGFLSIILVLLTSRWM